MLGQGATPSANLSPGGSSSRNAAQSTFSLPPSLLILAFQFPYESHCQEEALVMARQYVQNVISNVKSLALKIMPSGAHPARTRPRVNQDMAVAPVTPEASFSENLALLVSRSYR